jgi:hypothetical protein
MFCPRELGNCHRQPKALTSIRDFNALRSFEPGRLICISQQLGTPVFPKYLSGTARKVGFSITCPVLLLWGEFKLLTETPFSGAGHASRGC